MNHNLYSQFSANFQPEAQFIRDIRGDTIYRYRDLIHQSACLAKAFQSLGLRKGDRVMVQVEKSPQALFVYFACLRAGLIFLPLNTAYTQHELAYFVENAEPGLIICDPNCEVLFSQLSSNTVLTLDATGQGSLTANINPVVSEFENTHCEKDDIAAIIYTSGTTGKPKGAKISHGNLWSNVVGLSNAWGWGHDDIMLHVLPIFHIHGLFIATHLPVLNSSPLLFLPKFDPVEVIRLLPKATAFMGVPTHYVRLLDEPSLTKSICSNIRVFTSGSAPMLLQTHEEFKQRTDHNIVERYGMTEAGIITTNPIRGGVKTGTVGRPMTGVSLRVINNNNEECAVNKIGIIQVKGEGVFQGYWRMPEKSRTAFCNGYFVTCDLGFVDEEGFISISGRGKDLIITGGLNVYPKEIESVIDQIPGVVESAIIGLPHRDYGEAVTAVVVIEPGGTDNQSIIQFCKENIANFKVPKAVFIVDELPRNSMGKVLKSQLRSQFA